MAYSGSDLVTMMRDSVAAPGDAAERLLSLRPSLGVVLQGAVLVSALDALLVGMLAGGTFSIPTAEGELVLSPLMHAATLVASLLLSAGALQVGGQILGGVGRFSQSLLVAVWIEVIAIAVQLVQIVAGLLLPPLAPVLALAGLGILIWCLVHFTRTLHGFQGLGRAVVALLLGAVIVGIALSSLLVFLGFGGPPDV